MINYDIMFTSFNLNGKNIKVVKLAKYIYIFVEIETSFTILKIKLIKICGFFINLIKLI